MGSVASPITCKEMETLVNILPTKKRQEPESVTEYYQIFKE